MFPGKNQCLEKMYNEKKDGNLSNGIPMTALQLWKLECQSKDFDWRNDDATVDPLNILVIQRKETMVGIDW
jgi:hypothetical protein